MVQDDIIFGNKFQEKECEWNKKKSKSFQSYIILFLWKVSNVF